MLAQLKRGSVALLILAATALPALAEPTALPFSYSSGNPANAEDVNANFDTLAAKLPRNVIVVSPAAGGSATDSGTALLAALSGITDASASNPYLVKLAPGIYDLGAQSLTIPDDVDIEGSGMGNTHVTSAVPDSTTAGTIVSTGSERQALRFLAVENTAGGVALFVANSNFRTFRVFVAASGGAKPTGIYVSGHVSALLEEAQVLVAGGTSANLGVALVGDAKLGGTALLRNLIINAVATADGAVADGLVSANASPTLTGVRIQASATGSCSVAVCTGVGILDVSGTVTVLHSSISGSSYGILNAGGGGDSVKVGTSQVIGGVVASGQGSAACFAVYDQNLTTSGGPSLTGCPAPP
jgi:hypothetical protein